MAKSCHGRMRLSLASRLTSILVTTVLISLIGCLASPMGQADGATPATINGDGSPYSAPAVTAWLSAVAQPPYSLPITYTVSNSIEARYEFTEGTYDFAISETGYVDGATPPSFPYAFIPLVGTGIAFMYHIPGLSQTLQLTSYTACLAMTGQVTDWDDPVFHENGANAGVTLPDLPIVPVTESDPEGINLTMEQYCIDEQPAVWAQYAQNMEALGVPPSGVPISATTAGANWEAPGNGYDEQSTSAVASNVASDGGAIGFVEENYAADEGFSGSSPAQGVSAVENASGDFTLPTPLDATSALAYATTQSDGLVQFNFDGLGPNVYNPSTVSYLLTPTTGWSSSKGDTMSQFVDFALTLGQQEAPKFGYASLGQNLEQDGLGTAQEDIPGAVPETAAELAVCDLTISEVQAGETTPTCGSGPGTGTPEVPFVLALPVAALGIFGGSVVLRRRRDRRIVFSG
jgi:phosphate transport system substrate-binding protein